MVVPADAPSSWPSSSTCCCDWLKRMFDGRTVARRLFGKLRETCRHLCAGPLAAFAAAHAIAYDIYATAGESVVFGCFFFCTRHCRSGGLDATEDHESRPFLRLCFRSLPLFRPLRLLRKWKTSASESLARHRRNVGNDLSMYLRSCAISRQYCCTCSSLTKLPEKAA